MTDDTTDLVDVARGAELLADLDAAARAWSDARSAVDAANDRYRQVVRQLVDTEVDYERAQARYEAWAKAPLT